MTAPLFEEHSFRVADDPERARALFPEVDGADGYAWAYAVTGPSGAVFVGWLSQGNEASSVPGGFAEHVALNRDRMATGGPRAIWEAALVLLAFEHSARRASLHRYLADQDSPEAKATLARVRGGGRVPTAALDRTFPERPEIDGLLWESRGALAWRHQFENLARLGGLSYADAVDLRKGVMSRKLAARDAAGAVEVAPGLALRDVLDERAVYGGVPHSPNLQGARTLLGSLGDSGSAHR